MCYHIVYKCIGFVMPPPSNNTYNNLHYLFDYLFNNKWNMLLLFYL